MVQLPGICNILKAGAASGASTVRHHADKCAIPKAANTRFAPTVLPLRFAGFPGPDPI